MNLIEDKICRLVATTKMEQLRYSAEFVKIRDKNYRRDSMINIFNIYHGIEYSIKKYYWIMECYDNNKIY